VTCTEDGMFDRGDKKEAAIMIMQGHLCTDSSVWNNLFKER